MFILSYFFCLHEQNFRDVFILNKKKNYLCPAVAFSYFDFCKCYIYQTLWFPQAQTATQRYLSYEWVPVENKTTQRKRRSVVYIIDSYRKEDPKSRTGAKDEERLRNGWLWRGRRGGPLKLLHALSPFSLSLSLSPSPP